MIPPPTGLPARVHSDAGLDNHSDRPLMRHLGVMETGLILLLEIEATEGDNGNL